jgi:outer membrane protein OmpA-like peptidoglycan-associated protein
MQLSRCWTYAVVTGALSVLATRAGAQTGFVPGDRTLFQTDYADEQLGALPQRLFVREGMVDVVQVGPQRYVRASSRSVFTVPLPELLPDRFTLQIDFINLASGDGEVFELGGGAPPPGARLGTVVVWGADGVGVVGGNVAHPLTVDPARSARYRGRPAQLWVQGEGTTVRVYLDGQLLADVPGAAFERSNILSLRVAGRAPDNPAYVGRIRVAGFGGAAGAPIAAGPPVAVVPQAPGQPPAGGIPPGDPYYTPGAPAQPPPAAAPPGSYPPPAPEPRVRTGKQFLDRITGHAKKKSGDVAAETATNVASAANDVVDTTLVTGKDLVSNNTRAVTASLGREVRGMGQSLTAGSDAGLEDPPDLSKALKQGRVVLRQLRFYEQSPALDPVSNSLLTLLGQAITANPGNYLLEVHVDPGPDPSQAQVLSEGRAATLKQSLLSSGLPADRIAAVGLGATRPNPKPLGPGGVPSSARVEIARL